MSTLPGSSIPRRPEGSLLTIPWMTGTQLLRGLWLGVGLTLPLFGVEYFRVYVDTLGYIALPMLLLGAIVALGAVMCLMQDPALPRPLVAPRYRPLLIVLCLFLLWHVFSLLSSTDHAAGRREVIKLALALMCFGSTLAFFPRDRRFFEQVSGLALWASVLMVAYLIYVYAFVFRSTFLGTTLEEQARSGRNQLAWYLAVCFPYAMVFFLRTRWKLLFLAPVMTLLVAVLYLSSRSAWLSIAAGLLSVAVVMWRQRKTEAVKLIVLLVGGGGAMLAAGLWLITLEVDSIEIVRRFVSIFWPEEIPELHSYEARWAAVEGPLQQFLRAPLLGIGLANAPYYADRVTHDDYVTVLSELGLVGMTLFGAALLLIAREILVEAPRDASSWVSVAAQAAFVSIVVSLFFINVYTSVHFWLFMALILISCEIGRSESARGGRIA